MERGNGRSTSRPACYAGGAEVPGFEDAKHWCRESALPAHASFLNRGPHGDPMRTAIEGRLIATGPEAR